MTRSFGRRRGLAGLTVLLALVLAGVFVPRLKSADHIDAPVTTNSPTLDINDQFVFRSPSDASRIVFAMTMNPLIAPTDASSSVFPTNVLYQWKIDTDADNVEDLVIQARVVDDGGQQVLVVRGPAAPSTTGIESMELTAGPVVSGPVSGATETRVIDGAQDIRAFAGVRDDPFYIDLTRLLAVLAGQETQFRNPGEDTLLGLNTLAIVVEVPRSLLGGAANIGVWATSSRIAS